MMNFRDLCDFDSFSGVWELTYSHATIVEIVKPFRDHASGYYAKL